jgi:hypothetical protein
VPSCTAGPPSGLCCDFASGRTVEGVAHLTAWALRHNLEAELEWGCDSCKVSARGCRAALASTGKTLPTGRIGWGWRPLFDRLQLPNEQSGSAHHLAATGAGIAAAVTPAKMLSKAAEGPIIKIGDGKRSAARPADDVLGRSNVLACGDLGIAALNQRFCKPLDGCSCRTAADLPDAERSVKNARDEDPIFT